MTFTEYINNILNQIDVNYDTMMVNRETERPCFSIIIKPEVLDCLTDKGDIKKSKVYHFSYVSPVHHDTFEIYYKIDDIDIAGGNYVVVIGKLEEEKAPDVTVSQFGYEIAYKVYNSLSEKEKEEGIELTIYILIGKDMDTISNIDEYCINDMDIEINKFNKVIINTNCLIVPSGQLLNKYLIIPSKFN